jgi:Trypsin
MKEMTRDFHVLFPLLLVLFSTLNIEVEGIHSLRGASGGVEGKSYIKSDKERNLIIGGRVAAPNEYPYFAHLDAISCGGSLIAPDIVLTAGHVS